MRAWPGAKIESAGSQRKDQLGGAAGAQAAAWTPPFNAHRERCEQKKNDHKSVLLMLAAPGVGGDCERRRTGIETTPNAHLQYICSMTAACYAGEMAEWSKALCLGPNA